MAIIDSQNMGIDSQSMGIGFQIMGLALLLAGLIGGEALLQRRAPLSGAVRQARLLALAAGVGGLVGAPAWWQNLPFAFSWGLPPLGARYLAVAGLAFGLTALRAAWIGSIGHLRLLAALLAVYLGPLTVAIVTRHLDRFDPAAPVTYAFFAIVLTLLTTAVLTLMRLPSAPGGRSPRPLMEFGPLAVIGGLAGVWGLALFLWPAGPLPQLWPWPQDPLTTRLIAAMFLTIAAAALLARGPAQRATVHLLCLTYGAGIAGTTTLALMAGKPASLAYLAFWATAALIALMSNRAAASTPAPSRPD